MASAFVASLLETMPEMEKLERDIAELYAACAKAWPDNADYWNALSQAELKHADYLSQMADIVKQNPEAFSQGRPFNVKAVGVVRQGVAALKRQVEAGELSQERGFFLAKDLEQSIIEKNYAEIVRTNEKRYNELISKIVSDTKEHHAGLLRRAQEHEK